MRVAIFSTLWGSSTGGIDVCSKQLILSWAKEKNCDVCAAYKVRSTKLLDDAKDHGFLAITPDAEMNQDINASALGPWTNIESRAIISQLLNNRFSPDVVFINDIFGRKLIPEIRNWFPEAKVVSLIHSAYGRSEARKGVTDTSVERKEKYQRELIEESDLTFSVGSFSEEYLRYLAPQSSDKIGFILPGMPEIKTSAQKSTRFNAASFGRLDRKTDTIKQISVSAEAWAAALTSGHIKKLATEDVTFTAIGSNGAETVLDELKAKFADKWSVNLRELPFEAIEHFESSELRRTLDRCSFVMLNSWYENFGLTYLETCTFGVPTVISRSSGFYVDAIGLLGPEIDDITMSVETNGVSIEALTADIEKLLIAATADYDRTFDNAQIFADQIKQKWPTWADAIRKITTTLEANTNLVATSAASQLPSPKEAQVAATPPAWEETIEDLMSWCWSKNILQYNNLEGLPQFRNNSELHLTPLQKKFWECREDLIRTGFTDVILSGGTSSGKTTLAESLFGLARPNEFSRARILYVAPTKALAQEKARTWYEKYPAASIGRGDFEPVIVSTGDDNASDGALIRGEFNIASTVYEKANVILSASQELFDKINLVVIDEFHMIEDLHRGTILEALLAKIQKEKEKRLKSVDRANHLRLVIITTEGVSPELQEFLTYVDLDTLEEVPPLTVSDTSRATPVKHSALFPGKTPAQGIPLFEVGTFDTTEKLSLSEDQASSLSASQSQFQKTVT